MNLGCMLALYGTRYTQQLRHGIILFGHASGRLILIYPLILQPTATPARS
jgi:hypothetical protein